MCSCHKKKYEEDVLPEGDVSTGTSTVDLYSFGKEEGVDVLTAVR